MAARSHDRSPQKRGTVGLAFVFTNSDDEEDCYLPGTKNDDEKWRKTLKELKFDVRGDRNLSASRMREYLGNAATIPIDPHNCRLIVFVFCGHGEEGIVISQDGVEMLLEEDILPHLFREGKFANIDKIFIFDCCRTPKRDRSLDEAFFNVWRTGSGGYLYLCSTPADSACPEYNNGSLFTDIVTKKLAEGLTLTEVVKEARQALKDEASEDERNYVNPIFFDNLSPEAPRNLFKLSHDVAEVEVPTPKRAKHTRSIDIPNKGIFIRLGPASENCHIIIDDGESHSMSQGLTKQRVQDLRNVWRLIDDNCKNALLAILAEDPLQAVRVLFNHISSNAKPEQLQQFCTFLRKKGNLDSLALKIEMAMINSGFHSEVFMDNYKDRFLRFVDVGAILTKLKDGDVIPEVFYVNISDKPVPIRNEITNAVFLHLRSHATPDTIYHLCEAMISTPTHPNMCKLGRDMRKDTTLPIPKPPYYSFSPFTFYNEWKHSLTGLGRSTFNHVDRRLYWLLGWITLVMLLISTVLTPDGKVLKSLGRLLYDTAAGLLTGVLFGGYLVVLLMSRCRQGIMISGGYIVDVSIGSVCGVLVTAGLISDSLPYQWCGLFIGSVLGHSLGSVFPMTQQQRRFVFLAEGVAFGFLYGTMRYFSWSKQFLGAAILGGLGGFLHVFVLLFRPLMSFVFRLYVLLNTWFVLMAFGTVSWEYEIKSGLLLAAVAGGFLGMRFIVRQNDGFKISLHNVSDMIMNGFNEIIVASFAGDHYFFVTIFLVFIGEVLGGALRILMRTILSEGPMNALVYVSIIIAKAAFVNYVKVKLIVTFELKLTIGLIAMTGVGGLLEIFVGWLQSDGVAVVHGVLFLYLPLPPSTAADAYYTLPELYILLNTWFVLMAFGAVSSEYEIKSRLLLAAVAGGFLGMRFIVRQNDGFKISLHNVSDMIMNGFNEIIVASFAGDHYFFVTIFLVFIGEVLGGALRILMRTILSEGPMNALVYVSIIIAKAAFVNYVRVKLIVTFELKLTIGLIAMTGVGGLLEFFIGWLQSDGLVVAVVHGVLPLYLPLPPSTAVDTYYTLPELYTISPSQTGLKKIIERIPQWRFLAYRLGVPYDHVVGLHADVHGGLLALQYWRDGYGGMSYPPNWRFLLKAIEHTEGKEVAERIRNKALVDPTWSVNGVAPYVKGS